MESTQLLFTCCQHIFAEARSQLAYYQHLCEVWFVHVSRLPRWLEVEWGRHWGHRALPIQLRWETKCGGWFFRINWISSAASSAKLGMNPQNRMCTPADYLGFVGEVGGSNARNSSVLRNSLSNHRGCMTCKRKSMMAVKNLHFLSLIVTTALWKKVSTGVKWSTWSLGAFENTAILSRCSSATCHLSIRSITSTNLCRGPGAFLNSSCMRIKRYNPWGYIRTELSRSDFLYQFVNMYCLHPE